MPGTDDGDIASEVEGVVNLAASVDPSTVMPPEDAPPMPEDPFDYGADDGMGATTTPPDKTGEDGKEAPDTTSVADDSDARTGEDDGTKDDGTKDDGTKDDGDGAKVDEGTAGDATKTTDDDVLLLDPRLVAQGQALGLTPEQFGALGSNDVLKVVVGTLQQAKDGAAAPPAGAETGAGAGAATKTAEESDDGTVKPYKVTLKEEDFHPEVIKELQAMSDHQAEQLNVALQQVKDIQLSMDIGRATEFSGWLDGQFEGLDKSHKDLFGKGPVGDLAGDGEPLKNRNEVVGRMDEINAGRIAVGRQAMPREALFKQAVAGCFSETADERAREDVSRKLTHRAGQRVARPKSRTRSDGRNSDQRALAAAQEKLDEFDEHGGEPEEGDTDFVL